MANAEKKKAIINGRMVFGMPIQNKSSNWLCCANTEEQMVYNTLANTHFKWPKGSDLHSAHTHTQPQRINSARQRERERERANKRTNNRLDDARTQHTHIAH